MKYEVNEASPRHKETLHIINLVSKALGIGMKTLTGKSRQRHIVDARRVCYALLQEKMQLPAIHIGAYFGKDHANIRHHQKEHPLLYRVYPDYKLMYDKAEKVVNANEYVEHDIYECVNNMLLRKIIKKESKITMLELFKNILKDKLTPNQLLLLYGIKNKISFPIENKQDDARKLIKLGLVVYKKGQCITLTPKR